MVGTQPAIERTSLVDFGRKLQGNCAGFVVRRDLHVEIGVAEKQRLERTVIGTALADKNFSIAQEDARVNYFFTFGADGFCQFPKNFLAVFLYQSLIQCVLQCSESVARHFADE